MRPRLGSLPSQRQDRAQPLQGRRAAEANGDQEWQALRGYTPFTNEQVEDLAGS